jgi:hypothetical protein
MGLARANHTFTLQGATVRSFGKNKGATHAASDLWQHQHNRICATDTLLLQSGTQPVSSEGRTLRRPKMCK